MKGEPTQPRRRQAACPVHTRFPRKKQPARRVKPPRLFPVSYIGRRRSGRVKFASLPGDLASGGIPTVISHDGRPRVRFAYAILLCSRARRKLLSTGFLPPPSTGAVRTTGYPCGVGGGGGVRRSGNVSLATATFFHLTRGTVRVRTVTFRKTTVDPTREVLKSRNTRRTPRRKCSSGRVARNAIRLELERADNAQNPCMYTRNEHTHIASMTRDHVHRRLDGIGP